MRLLAEDFRLLRRAACRWLSAAALVVPLCGCEPPRVSPEELGHVVFQPEQVPGGQKHFALPEMQGEKDVGHRHEPHDGPHDHGPHPGQEKAGQEKPGEASAK